MQSVKAFALAISLVFTACAANNSTSKSGPVNVALVRHEIRDSLHGDRTIISMGHVEHDKAVVFTEAPDKSHHQETWVRDANGAWTMSATTIVANN